MCKAERIFVKGNYIQVNVTKTFSGDYIGTANFVGSLAIGVCRSTSKFKARKGSIERLMKNCDLIKSNDNKNNKNKF